MRYEDRKQIIDWLNANFEMRLDGDLLVSCEFVWSVKEGFKYI